MSVASAELSEATDQPLLYRTGNVAVIPPSIVSTAPVMKSAYPEQRNAMLAAMSSGSPIRPVGAVP